MKDDIFGQQAMGSDQNIHFAGFQIGAYFSYRFFRNKAVQDMDCKGISLEAL